MGRWTPKFDARQQQACTRTALSGMNAAAVVAAAAAGELEDDLAPFRVSESTVRNWARDARLATTGADAPPAAPDDDIASSSDPDAIADRALAILDKRMAALEEQTERGEFR